MNWVTQCFLYTKFQNFIKKYENRPYFSRDKLGIPLTSICLEEAHIAHPLWKDRVSYVTPFSEFSVHMMHDREMSMII